jgi:CRP/FNR family transcriptional regulator, cyclic AMP receptor protein
MKAQYLRCSQKFPAESFFYPQRSRAKLTVVSKNGRKATGYASLSREPYWREVDCKQRWTAHGDSHRDYRLHGTQDLRGGGDDPLMHQEHAFSDRFLRFLQARSMRT